MANTYYAFFLDEPATPAFCSFDKMYIGTAEDLLTAINRLQADGLYPNSVKAVREYLNGNRKAVHSVAYQERPALEPVQFITESKLILSEKKWEHLNAWKCPYNMKIGGAFVSQIVIKHDNQYYRCVRAWMKDLLYQAPDDSWHKLDGGFWGNRSILDVSSLPDGHFQINNLLYVVEDDYNTIEEAIKNIKNPESLVFDRICDEIFGDG